MKFTLRTVLIIVTGLICLLGRGVFTRFGELSTWFVVVFALEILAATSWAISAYYVRQRAKERPYLFRRGGDGPRFSPNPDMPDFP